LGTRTRGPFWNVLGVAVGDEWLKTKAVGETAKGVLISKRGEVNSAYAKGMEI
jgi:hypothetical protein